MSCLCPRAPAEREGPVPGRLFFVVGPSGAGKDTLIDEAGRVLGACPRYMICKRIITRPPEPVGEQNVAVTSERFARLKHAGAFALSWSAHGLDYGIASSVLADLAAGRHVIVNGSRGVIPVALGLTPDVSVILVTAPRSVLAVRLAARGRESAEAIEARLARDPGAGLEGVPDEALSVVQNDGSVADGTARFLAALGRAEPFCARLTGDPTGLSHEES